MTNFQQDINRICLRHHERSLSRPIHWYLASGVTKTKLAFQFSCSFQHIYSSFELFDSLSYIMYDYFTRDLPRCHWSDSRENEYNWSITKHNSKRKRSIFPRVSYACSRKFGLSDIVIFGTVFISSFCQNFRTTVSIYTYTFHRISDLIEIACRSRSAGVQI